MLEHVPQWLGHLLGGVRAGHDKLVVAGLGAQTGRGGITVSSPAFANGARLPVRFTADGEGVSPPLTWDGVPGGAASLVLVVEDADAPTPQPLVHALVWAIPPGERGLAEGVIRADGDGGADGRDVGRNSYLAEGWLPPDPPTGHGRHDYVFQLFALSETPALSATPGRRDIVDAMTGRILGAGVLVGTYSRGETELAGDGATGLAPA